MEVFLRTVKDPGYWIQLVFAAFFTCLILGVEKGEEDAEGPAGSAGTGAGDAGEEERGAFTAILQRRPGKTAAGLFLFAGFALGIHFVMCVLTERVRALTGVGSWVAYIGAAVLLGRLWSSYEVNARRVCETVCFSAIVIVNGVGQILPNALASMGFPYISVIYTKTASGILLLLSSLVLLRHPVWKYYIGSSAAALSIACDSLSTMVTIIYDLFRTNVFGISESWTIMLLMSIVLVIFYLINMITYRMIYRLSREQTQVLELQSTAAMDESARALMQVTENNLHELHKINHDIKNQYAYMQSLLRRKDYKALEEYFEELGGTLARPLIDAIDCGNNVLNVILNMELAKAREAGVELNVQAAPPHTLPFRDLDLCNLYANVIDNAIEACVSEQIPQPKVNVVIHVTGAYLFSRVTNPTKKAASFLTSGPKTTKKDARVHGKGREIIRGIVYQYHGTMDTKIENGSYCVEFLLDLGAEV